MNRNLIAKELLKAAKELSAGGASGYMLAMNGGTAEERDVDDFIRLMKKYGYHHSGFNDGRMSLRQREELQGAPTFSELIGPMWGGNGKVRYETEEVYRQLSAGAKVVSPGGTRPKLASMSIERVLDRHAVEIRSLKKIYSELPAEIQGYKDDGGRMLAHMLNSWQASHIWLTEGWILGGGYGYQLTGGFDFQAKERGIKAITGEEFLKMVSSPSERKNEVKEDEKPKVTNVKEDEKPKVTNRRDSLPQDFINEMERLKFKFDGDRAFELSNRHAGYGDDEPDCYEDDEDGGGRYEDCMDSFYERGEEKFSRWANPILNKVEQIARKHRLNYEKDTSSEYGTIEITVNLR